MALFAVTTTQAPVGISADEFRRRLPQGYAYMLDLIEKGVIVHSWIRVGKSGGLSIFDVASHEELMLALYGNPISPHLEFGITPLAETGAFDPNDLPSAPE
ncbi:muconolactone Delta-isomerase family protein [Actinosynnema sp. NPDC023658]|uniref:muconolactone Delta-isomerase n=1 Tax=Actinosynnema sp. NPDC023658 TaxID=3155465 RepID=UPI0033C7E402